MQIILHVISQGFLTNITQPIMLNMQNCQVKEAVSHIISKEMQRIFPEELREPEAPDRKTQNSSDLKI